MGRALFLLSLVVSIAALVECVGARRGAAGGPLFALVRERFGRFVPSPALGAAVLYGAFLAGAPLLAAVALGLVRVGPAPGAGLPALGVLLLLVPVRVAWAAAEELISRGALLPAVARRIGGAGAVAISALLFAWAHLERTGAFAPQAMTLVDIALDGVAFALVFLETRTLWAPTLLHAAKNIVVGLTGGSHVLPAGALLAIEPLRPSPWWGGPGQAGGLDLAAVALVVVWLLVRRAGGRRAADLAWVRGI